jgi:hypothetical protein
MGVVGAGKRNVFCLRCGWLERMSSSLCRGKSHPCMMGCGVGKNTTI